MCKHIVDKILRKYYHYYHFYDGNALVTKILKISESHYAILSHFKRNYDGVREKQNKVECWRTLCTIAWIRNYIFYLHPYFTKIINENKKGITITSILITEKFFKGENFSDVDCSSSSGLNS